MRYRINRALGSANLVLGALIFSLVVAGIAAVRGHFRGVMQEARTEAAEMFMWFGSDGPFALTLTPSGERRQGERLERVRPGEVFAYTNTACIRADVSMRGELQLVRMPSTTNPQPEVVSRLPVSFRAAERPCGSAMQTMQVPPTAPFGLYHLVRDNIVLTPAHGDPRTISLPPLRFTVAP